MPELEISLLGPVQVALSGVPIPGLTSPKILALLAYLSVESRHAHSRQALAELLWPERPPGSAGQNLRKSLSRLQKAIPTPADGEPYLLADHQTVQFNARARIRLDVGEFASAIEYTRRHTHRVLERCRRCCARLENAAALYRGEFLHNLQAESPAFDEWALLQREWHRRQVQQALFVLSRNYEWRRDYPAAYRYAWRIVEIDSWQESGHRQVMRALALMGRRGEALKQYDLLTAILDEELGLKPAEETEALVEAIKTGALGASSGEPAPSDIARLPVQHSAFIGREAELALIAERLDDPNCHLLTLVGLGGVGKSRLALQIAAEKGDEFRDGVRYVPLAALETGAHLLSALAEALRLPASGADQSEAALKTALLASLQDVDLLLIMDNYEHLLPDTSLLVELLDQSPGLKVLVTSRQPLQLRAEWIINLEGLSPPSGDGIEAVEASPAAALFRHHAARKLPDFKLDHASAASLASICRMLAGLPLAIELAAASLRSAPLEEIAGRIANNLDFLATSALDSSRRHRSLRAVFESSWILLSREEREALCSVSIFHGDFSLDAAREVTGAGSPVLAALVQKSLLRTPAEKRYDMHPMLRLYAAEKLAKRPELAGAAARHAAAYIALLAALDEDAWRTSPAAARARISAEVENVRAAWRWVIASGRLDLLEKGYRSLAHFYAQASYLEEGCRLLGDAVQLARQRLEAQTVAAAPDVREALELRRLLAGLLGEQTYFLYALARYPETIERAREVSELCESLDALAPAAKAALYWGSALMRQGEAVRAVTHIEAACNLAGQAGLAQVQADGLRTLGMIYVRSGDYALAGEKYHQSLALCRERGYRWGEAHALGGIGNVRLVQERAGEARGYYRQAIEIFEDIGDQAGLSTYLDNLATTHWAEGDYDRAAHIHKRSFEIREAIGDRRGLGATLVKLGIQAHYQGDFSRGEARYRKALDIYRKIGYRRGEGEALAHLCLLNHQRGDNHSARRYGEQAIDIARELQDPSDLGYGLTFLGHTLSALGCPAEAQEAYREALDLRLELGEHNRALEPRAGLAQVALGRGDLELARVHAEAILAHIESGRDLSLVDEPGRVYLAAFQALAALDDERAGKALEDARRMLRSRAEKIADLDLRRVYLEEIPIHRMILSVGEEN